MKKIWIILLAIAFALPCTSWGEDNVSKIDVPITTYWFHKPDKNRLEELHAFMLRHHADDKEIADTLARNKDLAVKARLFESSPQEAVRQEMGQYLMRELFGPEEKDNTDLYFHSRNKPAPFATTHKGAFAAVYDDYAAEVEKQYLAKKELQQKKEAAKREDMKSEAAKVALLGREARYTHEESPDILPGLAVSCLTIVLSVVFLILAIKRKRRNAKSGYGVWLFLSRFFCVATALVANSILELEGIRLGALPLIGGCIVALFVPQFFARLYSNRKVVKNDDKGISADGEKAVKKKSCGWIWLKIFAMIALSVIAMILSDYWLSDMHQIIFGICIGTPSYFVISFVCDAAKKSATDYKGDSPQKALSYGMMGILAVLIWITIVSVLFHAL